MEKKEFMRKLSDLFFEKKILLFEGKRGILVSLKKYVISIMEEKRNDQYKRK